MADENEPKNERPENRENKVNKSINVTRPQQSLGKGEQPKSNFDSSRISAHTLREQQALDKLRKKVGAADVHSGKKSQIKSIIAIILIIILIALMIIFIMMISGNKPEEQLTYDVRVSMEIENKSLLSIITETGKEELREINPGDKFPISAYARNSNDYEGDVHTNEMTPPSVYLRFKLKLILNYEERYDILIPTMTSNWYIPQEGEENQIGNVLNDKYFYYCGSIPFQRKVELFSALEFSGDAITCEDADKGRYGQIQVIVETVEANPNYLADGIWPTAPKKWVSNTYNGLYNSNIGEVDNEEN